MDLLSEEFDLPIDSARFWDACFLIWKPIIQGVDYRNLPFLKYMNNFISTHVTLTEKTSLVKTGMKVMGVKFFDVHPETYEVPFIDPIVALQIRRGYMDMEDIPQSRHHHHEKMRMRQFEKWITKPSNSYGGKEIKIFSEYRDLMEHCSELHAATIIQKYISNPLLLNKRKFDIRAHVLITPEKMWFSSIMYLRQAPENYDSTTENSRQHLTNIALHRDESNIRLFEECIPFGLTQEKVTDFISSLRPLFAHAQEVEKQYRLLEGVQFETFELLGLDIMFDQDLKPWLLEINKDPAFKSEGVHRVHGPALVGDTLREIIFHPRFPESEAVGETSFTEF
jgi:hypothetical protein